MSELHHYDHDKIELLPPELIMLRKELVHHWPTLWSVVGGMLIHDHDNLLEYMNAATESSVNPAYHTLGEGCEIWRQKLETMRRAASSNIILPSGKRLQ